MSQPTRAQIIDRAVMLLRARVPVNSLPVRLMAEYDLSAIEARDLAEAAIKQWRAQKPPFNTAGNGGKEKPGD